MDRRPSHRIWLVVLLLSGLPLACAVEGPGGPEEPEAEASTSGAGAAGATATSSTVAAATTGAGAGPTEQECPYEGASPIDPATLPPCPNCSAGGAHCVPASLVPPDVADQLDDCDASNKCVPDYFIETTGLFIAPTCESVAGAEGRCLNKCIPQVAAQADLLPQSSCQTHEVCTPCYDPQTGDPTGACSLSCDPGPVEPPLTLPKCCGGQGTCVPTAAAGERADQLGEDSCPQDGGALLCAPDVFVNDPNYKPESCETGLIQTLFGSEYAAGACLPECLPATDNFLIDQGSCTQPGFVCAPCETPIIGGSTGACDL